MYVKKARGVIEPKGLVKYLKKGEEGDRQSRYVFNIIQERPNTVVVVRLKVGEAMMEGRRWHKEMRSR